MTTIWINDEEELNMFNTALENATYIWNSTDEDIKYLNFMKRASYKFPNKIKSYPYKIKLTEKQWDAVWDAITHDRDHVQGAGAWGNPTETDPDSPYYMLDCEDAIECHKLCYAYDRFIERVKLKRMGFTPLQQLNTHKKYQPPADWL
tara:strand:- start:249 stop:692 length:444 start_codon:yes stop_codon:yes gene_type:complete